MKLKLLFSFLLFALFSAINSFAQTTLSPGDVAITGFTTDNPDQFVFVLLTDVEAGTQINFTDGGWDTTASGSFRSGEGTLTWSATSNLLAGTVIEVIDNSPFSASVGNITDSSGFQLSSSGDQILVYQGADTSPTFLNAITMDSTGWSNATATNDTALPPGLNDTVNALNFGEIDNGSFICPENPMASSQTNLFHAIMDLNNWELEDDPVNLSTTLGGGCSFTVGTSCNIVTGSNTIHGSVFDDFSRNGTYDADEPLESNVTINLYEDTNGNGIVDGGESIIQTTTTNYFGAYNFSVTPTVSTNQIFSKRIDQGKDDAQQEGNNSVVLNGTELKFKIGDPFIGTRFRNVTIPQGSVINSATVQFLSKDDQSGFLSYEISIQAIDDAPQFIASNNNISNRWDASNIVPWYNMPDWDEVTIYSTPDISPLVQSVVNRPGWTTGNDLALLYGHFDGPNAERKTESYEKIGNQASLLEINYDAIDPASYVVQIDETTLPPSTSLTTSNFHSISFTSIDEIRCDRNFGFTSPCTDVSGIDTDGDGINDACDLDDDNDGILDSIECSDLGKEYLLNADFENVDIITSGLDGGPSDVVVQAGVWKGDASYIPSWESLDTTYNHFEIWHNTNSGTSDPGGQAFSGAQWAEINASTFDGLYQDIATTPGDVLQWSFAHRKRTAYAGSATEDEMRLLIGDPSGTLTPQGDFSSANDASWTEHSGTYTVPAGQTTTRLTFIALTTVSGFSTSGNFVDKVQLYVIPNCENSDSDAFPDYQDIDSDNDGIPDNVEAQTTLGYLAPSILVNSVTGIYDNYGTGLTLTDTDLDGIFDYLDLDSDNDGTQDIQENGMVNIILNIDVDSDGLDDAFETNGPLDLAWDVNEDISDPTDLTILPDADNDRFTGGDVDYRDLFDTNLPTEALIDFDGVDDYVEVPTSVINSLDEFTLSFWIKPESLPTGTVYDSHFVMGQKDMFEIDLVPNGTGATIHSRHIYGPGQANSIGTPITTQDWVHYAVSVNYNTQVISIYKNGKFLGNTGMNGPRQTNNNPFRMGSKEDIQPAVGDNFDGWLDEVRIFNAVLTADQIQRMVYQEIENNGGAIHGKIINKDVVDINSDATIPWSNLVSYYPMSNIATNAMKDQSSYGNTAYLYNILTLLSQTAPMPYETVADGPWATEGTWLHGNVWDIEDVPNNKDWSIVKIHDNVTTSASHTQLGMFIDATKTLTVTSDNAITNSWYLQLDGTLDLADDSQLIQGMNSDLRTDADGKILRRQEGNTNYFWYNYWSSPVGATAVTDNTNTDFSISMLKDGTGVSDFVEFTSAYHETGKISNRWLYTFQNGQTYYDWVALTPSSPIQPGVGYTQKGINTTIGEQQYIFEGKPNNGTILLEADDVDGDSSNEHSNVTGMFNYTSTLIGNPYPSALDAEKFIADNPSVISGAIYVWEQWAGTSHNLAEYEGGYGTINMGSVAPAYQWNDQGLDVSAFVKTPTPYIPVGQGFFVEVVADLGTIEFNNSQRIFKKENSGESVFFRSSESENSATTTNEENTTGLIRLELTVSNGNKRNFVLLFGDSTTDGFDYGYDARTIDPQEDDLNSFLNDEKMVIQSFAPITDDKVIDLVFNSTGTYNYSIEIIEIENIPEDQDVYLRDNLTNTYFDLRSGAYSFSSDVNAEDTDRFDIVFQSGDTLSNDEFTNDSTIIFVNNTEDMLYVKGLSNQAKQLSITNTLGQTIKTVSNVSNQMLENGINISSLSTGVYVVSVQTENNQTIDKKVIIN